MPPGAPGAGWSVYSCRIPNDWIDENRYPLLTVRVKIASRPLAAALGTSERFWLNLQADHDLEDARRALGQIVKKIERVSA